MTSLVSFSWWFRLCLFHVGLCITAPHSGLLGFSCFGDLGSSAVSRLFRVSVIPPRFGGHARVNIDDIQMVHTQHGHVSTLCLTYVRWSCVNKQYTFQHGSVVAPSSRTRCASAQEERSPGSTCGAGCTGLTGPRAVTRNFGALCALCNDAALYAQQADHHDERGYECWPSQIGDPEE
jgi:hypothetical protein